MNVKESLLNALDQHANGKPILCASVEVNGVLSELKSDFNDEDFNGWLNSLDVAYEYGMAGFVWFEGHKNGPGPYLFWKDSTSPHYCYWQYVEPFYPFGHLLVA